MADEEIRYWDLRKPKYHRRYKYKLAHDYDLHIDIKPGTRLAVGGDFVVLEPNGHLRIKAQYAWDGPSGPTFDTPNFMRGSLVHDALYQLMRERQLDTMYRDAADRLLEKLCREDGMSKAMARAVYVALRDFGEGAAKPRPDPPLCVAPGRKR